MNKMFRISIIQSTVASLLLVLAVSVSGCAFIEKFVPESPPALIDYGYPDLQDIKPGEFSRLEDGRLATTDVTVEKMGRNVAQCLNVIESYSNQVSTFNQHYHPDNVSPKE